MERAEYMHFTGNGLEPIRVEGLSLGDAVRQAHTWGIYWVIGQHGTGYIIANEEGEQRESQTIGALSPYCRIEKMPDVPAKDAAGIDDLKIAVQDRRYADRIAHEAAARKHSEAKIAAIARFEGEYPNRVPDDPPLRNYVRAAKNIRKELAAKFPGVKFTVKSSSFSMGDSIDVSWELGPRTDEINQIIGRYEYGHFDGMQDLYELDTNPINEAFRVVMGSTKYAHAHREIPEELRARVVEDICRDYRERPSDYDANRMAGQALQSASFYQAEYDGVELRRGSWEVKTKGAKA